MWGFGFRSLRGFRVEGLGFRGVGFRFFLWVVAWALNMGPLPPLAGSEVWALGLSRVCRAAYNRSPFKGGHSHLKAAQRQ